MVYIVYGIYSIINEYKHKTITIIISVRFYCNMATIENEEEIIQRGYNVIVKNPQWIDHIKSFKNSKVVGLMWTDDAILLAIKDAIYLDNPIHSSSSLALTLNRCTNLINTTTVEQ